MRFAGEYRDAELFKGLTTDIARRSKTPARLMEFCGGHTATVIRYGIRRVLPERLEMVSGPGCPVCVSSHSDLDSAIAAARIPGAILTTFGDMMRVPGSFSSLEEEEARGADIRMVYSTLDALNIARKHSTRPVVFLGIGFETTAPTVAAAILEAQETGIRNFFVLSLHKICPPVIRTLLDSNDIQLSGLICPGHVSAVTGSACWDFIPRDYGIPCVIAGFEPLDLLQAVAMLVAQIEAGSAKVDIAYRRGVRPEGNLRALEIMNRVFEPVSARWRGIGEVPESGLGIRAAYECFDAGKVFEIQSGPSKEIRGCLCGDILRGTKTPTDCGLFATSCSPASPAGPCMVSSEGACAIHYLYGENGVE